ncbi:MAG: metallophosphoesterase, partial [Pseudomonadota bacterium]
MTQPTKPAIQALVPANRGHQFVFFGDSCSGVPGTLHAASLARVSAVVQRLSPPPEFIIFPGDEVIGLTSDEAKLRDQWRHWFDVEMAWLDRARTPLFHSTGNHTTYDRMSERVFADVLSHLPRNGPPDQEGLAYFIRRDDLLLVFIHTLCTARGGEGHIETDWLSDVLAQNSDARWKFVIGHHPAFPVNGYLGPYQR